MSDDLDELYRDASVRLDEQRRMTERAEAMAERALTRLRAVEALADSWTGPRSDVGPVTRAHGAQLRAALGLVGD